MKKTFILAALTGLVLTGCTQYSEVTTPPVTVTSKHSSTHERVKGFTEPVFRTVVKEGNKTTEAKGLKCTIDSAELKASFVTPAKVRIPTLKGKPTPLYISCKGGDLKGEHTVAPNLHGTAVGGASAAGLRQFIGR